MLQQLSHDYFGRRISFDDYRQQRRELLDCVDNSFNEPAKNYVQGKRVTAHKYETVNEDVTQPYPLDGG